MAKKIRKILPWLLILALIGGTMGLITTSLVKAEEQATTSGQVNNVAPTVSGVDLNAGTDITLTANTTTTVSCAATITDENGGDDISSCTAVIYRSGVGASCTADNNNCYIVGSSDCILGSAVGNDKNATATADIYFHADPTDTGTYSADTWQCQITGEDAGGLTGSGTDSSPPELNTLIAVTVDSSITYDALNPGQNMANLTKTVNVTTTGNAAIDIQLKGDDMTSGENTIAVGNQRYSTTTDDAWANGTALTGSYATLEMELPKPTTSPSDSTDTIYWGWAVPSGTPAGTYTGTNYFNPVAD